MRRHVPAAIAALALGTSASLAAPRFVEDEEDAPAIVLAPRLVDPTTGVSLRPPEGFGAEPNAKPSPKLEPGTIGPALRAVGQKGVVVVLVVETPEEAAVTQLSGEALNIMKSNFGVEQYSSEESFSIGSWSGNEYLFTEIPKEKNSEALCFVFGDKKAWHIVVSQYPKANERRDAIRAAVKTFERYSPERLDAILTGPMVVAGTPLGLRAPIAYWRAPADRAPAGAALALVPAYSTGTDGSLAVFAHPKAATLDALAAEAGDAIRAAGEGVEILKSEKFLGSAGREWRVVTFKEGEEAIVALLAVEGGQGVRIQLRVPADERAAATDVTVPVMMGADFATDAARKTRAQTGKERYQAQIKTGMPAEAAQFLVELVKSGDAKEAVPVLLAALAEKPQPVRLAAVRGLGALAAPQGLPGLKKLADLPPTKDGPEMAVQLAAIRALGALGDEKANPTLIKKIGETHMPSFDAALDALVQIGTPKKAVSDQIIRAWAKAESASKNPKDAAAKERLEAVGPKFQRALAYLTGEDFDSARAAREWWDKN